MAQSQTAENNDKVSQYHVSLLVLESLQQYLRRGRKVIRKKKRRDRIILRAAVIISCAETTAKKIPMLQQNRLRKLKNMQSCSLSKLHLKEK